MGGFRCERSNTSTFDRSDFDPSAAPYSLACLRMSAPSQFLAQEKFWANKAECDDAEYRYYAKLHGKVDGLAALTSAGTMELQTKLNSLEKENKTLKKVTDDLKNLVIKLEARVVSLEKGGVKAAAPAAAPAAADDDDDEEVDLFGESDEEESEEKKRITEERLKAYHEKKAKKPALIAKTSVLLDIKPWDDETDMDKMLECAKSIEKEGLVWGAHKLVPVGYGIKKLQLMCVVEDAKVSVEELSEKIEAFEDLVQSVDVAAMNKI